MKKSYRKIAVLAVSGILALSGCSSEFQITKNMEISKENQEVLSQEWALPFEFDVNAETFELSFQSDGKRIPISGKAGKYEVESYVETENKVSWYYPDEQIQVQMTQEKNYLEVQIISKREGDSSFSWPFVSADQYYLPLREGKRIPADNTDWAVYLTKQGISVMEQLSMPFWMSSSEGYCVLFMMENPYRTEMNFFARPSLGFSISHEYPEIDDNKVNTYRIYITEDNPVNGAKLYRNYVKEKGQLMTLAQKAEQNPNIEKLYGASFVYLWGENVISDEDVKWEAFRGSLNSPMIEYLRSFSGRMEDGNEFENVLKEIKTQDYVSGYQKNVICRYISQVLRQEDFWNPGQFTRTVPQMDKLLADGYECLTQAQKLQFHKYALSANLPDVFQDAGIWMDSYTVDVLSDMKEHGIDRAWIGLNSWEQAYGKPELVECAAEMGYLIASYDSYHSIHQPGEEQWITACFEDQTLYEEAAVTDKNGSKEKGFQNVGRKLNPALSMPAVQSRMEDIMSNGLAFNSWFIDCDATGEIYDDYTPGHITTQEQDLAARLERMSWIRDQYGFVIGSEGGNDFAASVIAFAHGIELPSFSWMDEDMKSNQDSEYYIGKYYNPSGGVAEHFSKRIPIKQQYVSVFLDPQYDIPLYKLVYNDSIITSYHWDWSTFKIQGSTQDRMVREVLYNVPPLYHLDREQWEEYKEDISAHHKVWSSFSRQAVQLEMTNFEYLQKDGKIQKTVYGDKLIAVANFDDTVYLYGNRKIPPHSVLICEGSESSVYTPSVEEGHR